jgi:hypothetical protein
MAVHLAGWIAVETERVKEAMDRAAERLGTAGLGGDSGERARAESVALQ